MKLIKRVGIIAGLFGLAFCSALLGCSNGQSQKIEAQMLDSPEWTILGEFDIDGLNYTPMKEIAVDGYEFVEVKVEYAAKDDIFMLAEICYEVDEGWPRARLNPLAKEGEMIVKAPIKKGSRFQILTQAFQKDCSYDGDYIVDKIKLSYRLTN